MVNFSQIARTYFPHLSVRNASRSLSRWIKRCPELWNELNSLGHIKGQRYLTPRMVNRINYYLGDPDTN